MTTTMTIRLDADLKNRLEILAETTKRSKSFLAAEALKEFIELNEWQLNEVKDAIKEADEGDFATLKEVGDTFGKWGIDAS